MASAVNRPFVVLIYTKSIAGTRLTDSSGFSVKGGGVDFGHVRQSCGYTRGKEVLGSTIKREPAATTFRNSMQVVACSEETAEFDRGKKVSTTLDALEARLVKRLGQTIAERQLLRPKQKILLAVSGGQDSVCLLHLMMKLNSTWGWTIGVVNCDHQWSESSRQASAHVAQMAQSCNLNYYQAVTTSSVLGEGLARTWRYGVFQRVATAHGYEVIVTAHTASDRVETLMYNLFRGTGISGLQSLTWKRWLSPEPSLSRQSAFQPDHLIDGYEDPHTGRVTLTPDSKHILALVRPLLDVTRSELRDLHQQLELPLWPDPSNHCLNIDRNRIRHELLPYLRKHFNLGIDKSLARWAEILHGEEIYLDNLCQSILSKAESGTEGSVARRKLDVLLLKSLPIALQRRILKQFSDNFTGKSLGFDAVERLRLTACNESSGARKPLQLSVHGGCSIRLQDDYLIIARDHGAME